MRGGFKRSSRARSTQDPYPRKAPPCGRPSPTPAIIAIALSETSAAGYVPLDFGFRQSHCNGTGAASGSREGRVAGTVRSARRRFVHIPAYAGSASVAFPLEAVFKTADACPAAAAPTDFIPPKVCS